jgi:hypothetical protein
LSIIKDYLASESITLYLNKSPFVNKNRVVDRAIRTIRDMLGINENFWLDSMFMMEVVEKYNNTKHSAFYSMFTPFEVQFTRDLERHFIKENQKKIEKIKEMQEESDLTDYEPRNILLIHLDFSKTQDRFNKKRRTFNKLAKFISYEFGNVKYFVYNVSEKYIKNPITIPICYTKYLAKNENSIPKKYLDFLNGPKN